MTITTSCILIFPSPFTSPLARFAAKESDGARLTRKRKVRAKAKIFTLNLLVALRLTGMIVIPFLS
jgi:hypothetical protein